MNWVDETISIRTNPNESIETPTNDDNVSFFEPSDVIIEELTDNEYPPKESDDNKQVVTATPPTTEVGPNRVTRYDDLSLTKMDDKPNAFELLELAKFKITSLEERIKGLLASTESWNTDIDGKSNESLVPDEGPEERKTYTPPTSDVRDVVVRPSELLPHEPVEVGTTELRNQIDDITSNAISNKTVIFEEHKSETIANILDPSVILVINDEKE